MAGVPSFISDGPWWGLFLFLLVVVFLRAQATYWAARGARRGAHAVASSEAERPSRFARHLDGPGMVRAQDFLDRWGFVGIPLSFLTIGFQTMVNAAAGYSKMRWDLYTLAMIPGCIAWATMYSLLGLSLLDAWRRSPWLLLAIVVALVVAAWAFTAIRRRRSADSAARTPR